MTRQLLTSVLLIAGSAISAEELVRNPFWPQGFEGQRHAISTAPRHPTRPKEPEAEAVRPKLKPGERLVAVTNSIGRVVYAVESERKPEPKSVKPAKAAEAPKKKTPEQVENELWADARKLLRTSDTLSFVANGQKQQSIAINGRVYSTGDLVSANTATNRFTWRICGISENGALRVERVRHRPLAAEELKSTKEVKAKNLK